MKSTSITSPSLHRVGLPLSPQQSPLARLGDAAAGHQVVEGDDLGADEAAGQVGVDGAGRVERRVADAQCPGAALVLAGGEEAEQAEQAVGQADHPTTRCLGDAEVLHEGTSIVGRQLRDLRLDLAGQRGNVSMRLRVTGASALLELGRLS